MRRSRLPAILTGLASLAFVVALAPPAAKACSCVPPDMILESIGDPGDQSAVFSGTVGPAVGTLVPVQVSEWYGGPPPAAIVTLEVSPGDGASCGTTAPPAGRQFLFVSYLTETGNYGLNLCSPIADLTTGDGQALRQDVVATLGPPFAVGTSPPSPTADPTSTPETDTADLASIALPVVGALLLAVLVVGGVFAIAGRTRKA